MHYWDVNARPAECSGPSTCQAASATRRLCFRWLTKMPLAVDPAPARGTERRVGGESSGSARATADQLNSK
jgi:hypothetical protein